MYIALWRKKKGIQDWVVSRNHSNSFNNLVASVSPSNFSTTCPTWAVSRAETYGRFGVKIDTFFALYLFRHIAKVQSLRGWMHNSLRKQKETEKCCKSAQNTMKTENNTTEIEKEKHNRSWKKKCWIKHTHKMEGEKLKDNGCIFGDLMNSCQSHRNQNMWRTALRHTRTISAF